MGLFCKYAKIEILQILSIEKGEGGDKTFFWTMEQVAPAGAGTGMGAEECGKSIGRRDEGRRSRCAGQAKRQRLRRGGWACAVVEQGRLARFVLCREVQW